MIQLNQRARGLKPSPTLAMSARSKELERQGFDVVNLTVGEPDWATPAFIGEAGIAAIRENFTKYTPAAGIIELREKIAAVSSRELGLNYKANEVVVGTGAKFVIASLLQMFVEQGDEVIIPAPYWVSYPTMVELAGGTPKFVSCSAEQNFCMSGTQLAQAITKKTKFLILCSPSNPTGMTYTESQLRELASVLKENPHVAVISDDIYNHLNLVGEQSLAPHLLKIEPSLRDRVLVVNGASKTFSMTGWRVGWVLGPASLMSVIADYFSQTTSNLNSISQKAMLKALDQQEEVALAARTLLKERKIKAIQALEKVSGLQIYPPTGAFYFWVGIEKLLGKKTKSGKLVANSKDFAEILLDEHHVATVPGSEFGAEGYLRLSFATSEAKFDKAASRIAQMANELK